VISSTKWLVRWYLGNYFPFVWFSAVQVGLVVKLKGRNKKKVFPMKSPVICSCPGPQQRGHVEAGVRGLGSSPARRSGEEGWTGATSVGTAGMEEAVSPDVFC